VLKILYNNYHNRHAEQKESLKETGDSVAANLLYDKTEAYVRT
jgi:hypothetical protein